MVCRGKTLVFIMIDSSQNYEILYAPLDSRDDILEFLKNEWDEDHVFVRNPDFFDFEHKGEDHYRFVIARDKISSKIVGTLGFIQYHRDKTKAHIHTVLWKVIKQLKNPSLGLELLNFLLEDNYLSVSSLGINEQTVRLYKFLKLHVGELKHYFLLNPEVENFNVARIPADFVHSDYSQFTKASGILIKIEKFDSEPEFDAEEHVKDCAYLNKRYFAHPYQDYLIYQISSTRSYLVFRIEDSRSQPVLRWIDFLGKEKHLNSISACDLINLLKEFKCEYLDFYQIGLKEETLEGIGLTQKTDGSSIVIPDYFSPFEQKNIKLRFFSNRKELRLFKGDGDQDRSNGESPK